MLGATYFRFALGGKKKACVARVCFFAILFQMNDTEKLVDRLLDSYRQHGGINHIDGVNLPSKLKIHHVTQGLLRLLFPGFLDCAALHSSELERSTAEQVGDLLEDFQNEILKSLEFQPRKGDNTALLEQATGVAAWTFFESLPEIRRLLVTDVEAAFDGDPAARSYEEIIVAYPCVEAIATQRMAQVLYSMEIALIPRIMTEWAHMRTGIDLHPGATIGESFFIDHGTGVVVGETARIGRRVKIYQGVTLGAKSFRKDSDGRVIKGTLRHPTIEDDVTIYAGATILGGDTVIGARSTVAGNTWLTQSVPPDSLVVSVGQELVIRPKSEIPGEITWGDYQI